MTKELSKYYSDLSYIQNNITHANQDIMTITGFMKTNRERYAHIIINAEQCKNKDFRTNEICTRYSILITR